MAISELRPRSACLACGKLKISSVAFRASWGFVGCAFRIPYKSTDLIATTTTYFDSLIEHFSSILN